MYTIIIALKMIVLDSVTYILFLLLGICALLSNDSEMLIFLMILLLSLNDKRVLICITTFYENVTFMLVGESFRVFLNYY